MGGDEMSGTGGVNRSEPGLVTATSGPNYGHRPT
jgi:hypothetical protein